MKITIEIKPYGTEIQEPIEGKDPEDWPVVGWSEGLRAVLSDFTNAEFEHVKRRTLEVEGMDDVAFQKLSEVIRMDLDQRFKSEHRDRIKKHFDSVDIHSAMRERFGKEGAK